MLFRSDLASSIEPSLDNDTDLSSASRAGDLGISASYMSVASIQATTNHLMIVLPTLLLSIILVLKPHSIGTHVLLGVLQCKAIVFHPHVTRDLNMETVLLKGQV